MDDPLQRFREVMLMSGITCVGLGLLLLFLTVWRSRWHRILEVEATFWRRLGVTGRWAEPLRRFEESRTLVAIVAVLLALHFLLLVFAVGAHAYFAPKLRQHPPSRSVAGRLK